MSTFSLVAWAFVVLSKKQLPNTKPDRFILFPSNSCIDFPLMFRSMIYFELIFMYKVRK